jgi:PAS domain S-box-containing protein
VNVRDPKQSELALARARDYADAIIRTARDPLVVLNADLRVHTANAAFYRTFEVSPSESEGRLVYELGNQQWNIPRLRELLEDILQHQSAFDDFEVTHDFEDLGRRTMLLNARRLDDAAGQPERILLGIQDVTASVTAQAVARLTQARNQALIDVSSQIVWTTDPSGGVIEDSPSWRAFTGQTLAQFQGLGWLDAIHLHDRERVRELWQRAMADRRSVDTECHIRQSNSNWRWMKLRAVPVLNSDGTVREWVGMNSDISQQKQAEENLRESEKRFTKFMRHLPGLAWIKDSDGRYVYANDAAQEAFGTTQAELYGKSDEELFPPETAAQFRSNDRLALESESSVQTIETLDQTDAVVHHSIVNKFAIPDATGKAALVGGIAIDITELKQAEQGLRDSEERYRTLFELGPVAVYSCDRAGVIQNFNRRAAELWGRAPAPGDTDPLFWGSFKMFRPDGSCMPHEQSPMAEVVAGTLSEVRDGEVHVERPDGRRVAVIVNIRPLKNQRGEITGAINCFYDITARKEAEEGRARLAAIVESSDDAIVSKDLNGVITSWNAGAERLFGYTAREAMGRPVTLLMPPDRLDEEPTVLAHIRRGEVVEPFETVRRRRDGTFVDVSVTVSPILDSQGQVVGASKIARDITERKKAAETLLEADRRKNEFLAMLAHELRNPLAPILVSIEILRRAKKLEAAENLELKPRVDHALDVLQRQVGQMVRLVDDLLDAGRISRGKIDLRRERVEMASVVHHAVEASRPLCERLNHELTVTLPSDPVFLDADPTRLAQIVGNLLNNACKFTERGGRIWLTVEREEDFTPVDAEPAEVVPQIVIRVRDTGVGIAPDRLDGIFDMFTQVDTSLERSLAGLGIGLTLVRTLAEMHGGSVQASSPGIGHGSEFVVRLPIAMAVAIQAPVAPTTEPAMTPLKILVVDDNRDSADMLATLLKFSGHETHTAHDGSAAVEAATKIDPDVILLDIGLPVLNGYEAARRIRERNGGRRRPIVVALTGWGQDEDRRRSEEAGFDAHVVKPVDDVRLRELLAELLSRRNQAVQR